MNGKRQIAVRGKSCLHCGFCEEYITCSRSSQGCVGCGACLAGCPQNARRLEERSGSGPEISFTVDNKPCSVKGPVSVLNALEELGLALVPHAPGDRQKASKCGIGGCWNCSVLIDKVLTPACITPLRKGMDIVTSRERICSAEPRRVVTLMRPAPHYHPSVFTHGCNFRCDLCHNWNITFSSAGKALSPAETVCGLALDPERDYWVGISGGEPTLNRDWLLQTVQKLRQAAPDIRIQLDTNGSLLTPEYIDELVIAGITDISPDLKAVDPKTFCRLCGIGSEQTARMYLETSWEAVRYIDDKYRDRVFMAVSLPYHPMFHSREELCQAAKAISAINRKLPVTLIEYQPAFRLRDLPFLDPTVMQEARQTVLDAGLENVLLQGGSGIPVAVDPLDLAMGSEEC